MSYLVATEFDRIQTMPISLPQTELRRQKSLQVATVVLNLGQVLELRSLNLHLIKILTPGVLPALVNTSLGLVSVGLYLGSAMTTGGIALVVASAPGVSSYHPAQPARVTAPGLYKVFVTNNSSNIDVTAAVTGSAKILA